MPRMRAKFKIQKVEKHGSGETLTLSAVGADTYGTDGVNEDNDFAIWTPFGELTMGINNPALLGVFNEGEKYYLDFTKAE
jgi:hypothetical protein